MKVYVNKSIFEVIEAKITDRVYLSDMKGLHYFSFQAGTIIELTTLKDKKIYVICTSKAVAELYMNDLFEEGLCRFTQYGPCNIFVEPGITDISTLVELADSEYKTPEIEEEEEE